MSATKPNRLELEQKYKTFDLSVVEALSKCDMYATFITKVVSHSPPILFYNNTDYNMAVFGTYAQYQEITFTYQQFLTALGRCKTKAERAAFKVIDEQYWEVNAVIREYAREIQRLQNRFKFHKSVLSTKLPRITKSQAMREFNLKERKHHERYRFQHALRATKRL